MRAETALLSAVTLLLPVAALSGWWIGRRERSREAGLGGHPRGTFAQDYFRGINYLLDDQHDKAIEVFLEVLDLSDEAIETHLALGSLFRRRGEVDRAIRVHQNLIARPALDARTRARALLELGHDYKRAGLLDRAESLYRQLCSEGQLEQPALTQLTDIYQQLQDWPRALEMAQMLAQRFDVDTSVQQAHFLCEMAHEAVRSNRTGEARERLKKAARIAPQSARVALQVASLERERGEYARAIKTLKEIERQAPEFLAEAIEPLEICYRVLGRHEEFIEWLKARANADLGVTPVITLAELQHEQGGEFEAMRVLVDELNRRPTVRGVDKLLEYCVARSEGEAQQNFALVKAFTSRLMERRSVYRCHECGFTGRTLYWQCPGCSRWETVTPIRGIEGE